MADTYERVWRQVRAHCAMAPALLVRSWVEEAYRELCDHRPWSWLRGQGEFILSAQKTGTVDVTRSSATVTGVGLTFASTDVGRQFRTTNNQPIYSILSVDTGANTAELDRVYGGTSASATDAVVLDAYVTCPSDFQRFVAVLDVQNNWRLHLWMTDDEINSRDAQRSVTGTPWVLASQGYDANGLIRYELWPYQTGAKSYPFLYIKRPEDLSDSFVFKGPLAQRGDILKTGAIWKACEWPGTVAFRNPYFNTVLAEMKKKEFYSQLYRLEVLDEEVYSTWIEIVSDINRMAWAPVDARFMQQHDIY